MQQAGDELIARWREVGQWWVSEPQCERVRYLDSRGIVREDARALPTVAQAHQAAEYDEDQSEEWSLRIRKTRDEKVAKACGLIPDLPTVLKRQVARPYAPLHVLSGYAFGRGTMLAVELPVLAAQAGLSALALTDPFSLAGAVEFVHIARKNGVKPLVGATIELPEGGELVLIARNATGYCNLSKLITECHLQEPRLFPLGSWERLARHSEGLLCLTGGDKGPLNPLITRGDLESAAQLAQRLVELYGQRHTFIEIERSYLPWEIRTNRLLLELAEKLKLMPVAGGEITHARRDHFPAQDILTCVETLCTVDEIIGRKPLRSPEQEQIKPRPQRALNAERFLRTPQEAAELYSDQPELLQNTLRVAELCEEDVLPKRTQLPKLYENPEKTLEQVVFAEAAWRYPNQNRQLTARLRHEVGRINRRGFAPMFLVVWDACRWAREQDIHFSGRGSVVDSAIAYALGFSRINAFKHKLHFDRFLPEDEGKRPDIDIDFEAHRRDDVRNYLRGKYGDAHVATVAAMGSYRVRGITREVGKALGLPLETINFLCKRLHGGVSANQLESALEKRPELRNSNIPKEKFQWVFRLAERLMDVPRNMRAHSSGVVISSRPLAETVPVMWSGAEEVKIIQWDKRSAKHFFDKFDILCLRGQDVLSGTERMVRSHDPTFDAQRVDSDHEENYRAMRAGQLIGIPQSASPAMRQAHQRLRTMNLHDASLVQAGIRPGVGGAVKLNELIQRRRGKPYSFVHPDLEGILGHTYGIIVYQEQVDQLLQTFAGYSANKAELMREGIHEKRHQRFVEDIKAQIYEDIKAQGYGVEVCEHVYDLVAGFQGYGFAQGHALAFAEISLRSIYCQREFPSEYFAALLNAQPAGYYGPHTIANEARLRGAAILYPDVNRSQIDFSVEDIQSKEDPKLIFPNGAIRVGLRQIMGVSAGLRERIVAERPYSSIFDFAARARPEQDELQNLVLCGALDSLGENRRALLWSIPKALDYARAVGKAADTLPMIFPEPAVAFSGEDLTPGQKAIYERLLLGMDIERHLMTFERARVTSKCGLSSAQAGSSPAGHKGFAVGNPIRLRFPPTSSGKRVMFFDLEDETGLLNVTCFDETYQRYGHAVVCNSYVTVFGEAQDRDGHTAFLAERILPYTPCLENQTVEPVVKLADFLVG
ncbi:MAG: DNA polymerase III subunit alpha [Armatimonadetes bacterium]|nr:DNA polymerase III subunit alpha [Armatimonadota bacterium]